ncbi:MAG: ribonuclease R [Gammaproteobacteria bacterium]
MSKRKKKIKDPFAAREASNYENPIPSREYILEYLRKRGVPAKLPEVISDLALEESEQKEAIRRRLRAMERDGQIVFNRRGGYGLVTKMNLVPGRVIGHRDGYGFMVPDDASKDLYLSAHAMRLLFDGDRILARVKGIDRRGRREAEVAEILERRTENLVGRFYIENGVGFVVPENGRITQDIVIPPGQEGKAKNGQYVLVHIITYPTARNQAMGKVLEVLGEHMAPGMETDVAIRSWALRSEWPDDVKTETQCLTEVVAEPDKRKRVDLRTKPFVTIDGEDAKDFDDAVYCEKRSRGGWLLYVAIADVSHYVKPNTALDLEAKERGNSVYFPSRVIPMLPEVLSNGLCSLKPNCDRLSLVCEMTISAKGKMTGYEFYEAVIHSHARMTYKNVAAILVEHHKARRKQYAKLLPYLENLYALYKILHEKRAARGALDFDSIETKVVFGANRKIKEIVPVIRNDAHRLIEECMLMANVAAANFLEKNEIHSLYRIHEGPSPDKLADVRKFLAEVGLSLRGGDNPSPKDYARLLEDTEGRPDQYLIQTVLLRSLSQAIYTPENKGHFGLSYTAYTHFTSPIRRYPDLIVHRAIKHVLQRKSKKKFYDLNTLSKLGEHCSITERRADEASRDVLSWLKCEYMKDRVGEEYDGIITGVTSFGLFVELKDIYVEGLLHVTSLNNDYYIYDSTKHRLRGERTGKNYRLADPIKVRINRVDLDERQIDFDLVEEKKTKKKR